MIIIMIANTKIPFFNESIRRTKLPGLLSRQYRRICQLARITCVSKKGHHVIRSLEATERFIKADIGFKIAGSVKAASWIAKVLRFHFPHTSFSLWQQLVRG